TFGQRAADAVAKFGGSWSFIMLFAITLVFWVILNSYILINYDKTFDPYPYILLNLFLSMLASIQAPIILMSQNRQGEKDRLNADHDYEVNLKAELEIMLLHEKIDALRTEQWNELIAIQKEQLILLGNLLDKN
ncbi:MAG: putative rane protein, partial [Pseudomonadota bacterium]